jgi:dipeptidyl aminopeptidase/acylaminoacyl peptidase
MDFPYYVTGGNAGFDVSGDGMEVCASSNPDANHWETTNKDLFVIPTSGGDPTNITAGNPGADMHPVYSPDGRYIAYLRQTVPSYESDRVRLAVYDRQAGESRTLTEDFDNWVEEFAWAPDAKSIYFLAAQEGSRPIYRVEVESARVSRVADLRFIDGFDVSPDGKSIAVARRSIADPREIWTCSSKGGKEKRLTTFNAAVEEEVDIRAPEEMWIESPTGRKVHTFVIKPHGFDPSKKYPLILNVHGGPQGQWYDSFRGDWQVYPAAGYVVVLPNPHGSTGYGQELTEAISRDWGGKVYEDLMAVTDEMARQPWIDAERMGVMGWSFGGYMVMWMAGHTDRFECMAAMMGLYDLPAFWGATEELWFPQYDLGGAPWESEDYTRWSPHLYAENLTTPTLVVTGMLDFRVPYTQSLEFFSALRKQGVPSRLLVFENDGHWPSWVRSMPVYYNAHLEWFHEYLGGDPAPYDTREMVRNRAFKNAGEE